MTSTRWFSVIAALALCGAASGAQARVVGFGFPFGVPLYAGPPAYYYAPQYYAPQYYAPPAYYGSGTTFSYTPPSARARQSGYPQARYPGTEQDGEGLCRAGPYTCPLVADVAPGGPCSCPSNDGRRVRGRAY